MLRDVETEKSKTWLWFIGLSTCSHDAGYWFINITGHLYELLQPSMCITLLLPFTFRWCTYDTAILAWLENLHNLWILNKNNEIC